MPHHHYHHAVCIPAFDEDAGFLHSLQQTAAQSGGRVLLLLIINQPQGSPPCENNRQLHTNIRQLPCLWRARHVSLHRIDHMDILLLDYFSDQQIPPDKGVGMARKIIADIAAFLHTRQQLPAQFFCSDADAVFPPDYFAARIPPDHSAAVLDFQHIAIGNTAIDQATVSYEQSIRHYVDGLATAGSPYAFHTIGSCLLLDVESYIRVRGFPQRNGAEDFYLLNKLNKQKPVASLATPILRIRSRDSQRVPFGTGPAVSKLVSGEVSAHSLFYPERCFATLANWLQYLDRLAEAGHYQAAGDPLIRELAGFFDLQKQMVLLCKNNRHAGGRKKHLHDWFDAFKTLKMIRYVQQKEP